MMGTVFRWLFRFVAGLIALAVVSVLGIYYLASRSLPQYDGEVEVAGLRVPLEIVRDNANVPHIFPGGDTGASGADDPGAAVFFGLGYAHAQDRLWQMTILRRSAQGRLSEVFGPRTAQSDALLRRLDLYGLASASLSAQSPSARAALDAYADGVNARLAEINSKALGRGAPEMFVFSAPIAPWRAADSLAVLKLLGLQLSDHLQTEVLRARVSLSLADPGRVRDLLPDAPGKGVAELPEYAALFPGAARHAAALPTRSDPLLPQRARGFGNASNAFAAAPARSAAGGTLLAGDPHMTLSAPSIWYLARLELPGGGVIGGTIPGIPAILAGRSAALGWAMTSAYLDDQDVMIEELNPENPEQYRTPTGFSAFATRRSIMNIRGAAPVTLTLRWTANGPVLPGSQFNLGTVTPPGHVTALRWSLLRADDASFTALHDLMGARTVREAIRAAEPFVGPAQVLTLADRATIAMKLIGTAPRRHREHQSKGRLPVPGWRIENRWQGDFPYASNPEFITPQGGILGNTNNKFIDRPFPGHISYDWGDTQRVMRWQRQMQAREVHTRDSFIEAQLDPVSFSARGLLPFVGAELWYSGAPAPPHTPEGRRQRALRLLSDWNGEMNEHMPEPLLYAAWMRALQDRLIRDDLGPVAADFPHLEPLFIERVFRGIDGAQIWCDVAQSAAIETCADIARLALDDALLWITERYGDAFESLRWGDAHQATHDHPALGSVPLLRYFVNIRQSTSGGDNTLLRGLTRGTGDAPFENVHGAGFRGVYDFADPDSSVFVISTGQSGHPLSRHYDDLAQLWRRGEYVPMSLDSGLARAAAVGVMTLVPAR